LTYKRIQTPAKCKGGREKKKQNKIDVDRKRKGFKTTTQQCGGGTGDKLNQYTGGCGAKKNEFGCGEKKKGS